MKEKTERKRKKIKKAFQITSKTEIPWDEFFKNNLNIYFKINLKNLKYY